MEKTVKAQNNIDKILWRYNVKGHLLLAAAVLLLLVVIVGSIILVRLDPFDISGLETLVAVLYFPIAAVVFHRYTLAKARLDLVPVTSRNFSDIYEIVKELCEVAGLKQIPHVYLSREEGVDPCYQNPGLRKNIIIGSDFYAGCRENNTPEALRFMLAHQVGHFVMGHNRSYWLLGSTAAFATPILGATLAKNLECSADSWAALQVPAGSVPALGLCALGKDNYPYLTLSEDFPNRVKRPGLFNLVARWAAVHAPVNLRLEQLIKTGRITLSQDQFGE